MILGARAHDFGCLPPEELAARMEAAGVTCVQLALTKALAGVPTGPGCLSPGYANYVADTFRRHGIRIAVLGCYINLIHPDPDERRRLLDRFKELIRYARDFDCAIVGTETGSLNADYSFHPGNHGEAALQALVDSAAELAGEAEKFGVLVGLEGVAKHVANTPRRLQRVLAAVPSRNLQVIFDPVNFITAENHLDQDAMLQESFDLFGERIVMLHAKDFVIEGDRVKTVPPGKGLLNYPLLIRLIKAQKPYIYTSLEDTKPEFLGESMEFIRKLYAAS